MTRTCTPAAARVRAAASPDGLHVHKSTVKYRVARAVAQRGRPLEDDRLELELALTAVHWLGEAVLPER
ncbi:helix-turn-helix domain-containing protein [Streptomyces sp. NRRL S-813]|uniref:helix-turn-helix domain-containing protein n=1 Tax=Streptomyces sp. NRRL S-813 TaxID=1463919 RepID=UPI0007C864DF|nr:helix-turn-helix domain-containing protein [Streptomyces sp. NRRL S-813]